MTAPLSSPSVSTFRLRSNAPASAATRNSAKNRVPVCVAAFFSVALALVFSGCSANYEKYDKAFLNGDYEKAYTVSLNAGGSGIAEKGKLDWQLHAADTAHLTGKLDAALNYYGFADRSFRALDVDSDALTAAQYATSMLYNDNALSYSGKAFERIMANTQKALVHLEKKDLEKARAALATAHDWQAAAVVRFAKEIDKQDKALAENKSKNLGQFASIDQNKILADSKFNENNVPDPTFRAYGDYVNPFTTYLIGITALLDKDYSRASDSLKNTSSMIPQNQQVKGEADYFTGSDRPASDRVWVIIENGIAPRLREVRVDVPIVLPSVRGNGRASLPVLLSFAFPKLVSGNSNYKGFRVDIAGRNSTLYSEVLCNMDAVSRAEYNKTISYTTAREICRGLAKAAIQYAANSAVEKQDALVRAGVWLVGAVGTAATTGADTRQWTTLPKDIHLLTFNMPKDRTFRFGPSNGGGNVTVTIPPCKNAIVYFRIPTLFARAPLPRIITLD
jgi:hypothetical protein